MHMNQNVLTITAADQKNPLIKELLKKLCERDEALENKNQVIEEINEENKKLKEEIQLLKN